MNRLGVAILLLSGAGCASEQTGLFAGDDAGVGSEPGQSCAGGGKSCGGACVPLDDPKTGCGGVTCAPCTMAHGTAKCANGACAVAACEPGRADCNGEPGDGCEVDLRSDPKHCGACAAACGGDQVCAPSGCAAGCPANLTACNGACVDLSADTDHCGGCTTKCTAPANAAPRCSGSCGFSCSGGFAPCAGHTACCPSPVDAGPDASGPCDPTTTCAAAVPMGSVRGDLGLDVVKIDGTTSEWLRVVVAEGDSSFAANDLQFAVSLTSPPGMDFNLFVYVSPCGSGSYGESTLATGVDSVRSGWADTFGFDDTRTVLVEVRYASGGVCGASWTLGVAGD